MWIFLVLRSCFNSMCLFWMPFILYWSIFSFSMDLFLVWFELDCRFGADWFRVAAEGCDCVFRIGEG